VSVYPAMCGFCFSRPSAYETDDGLFICDSCGAEYERIKNESSNVVDRPRVDPAELCTRCGICCVILSARIEKEEADLLYKQAGEHNIPVGKYEEHFHTEEVGPNAGRLTIKFPCKFLRGRPLEYVSCAVYTLDRPSVCRSYLCKIAIKYSLSMITLQEALFLIRASFLSRDLSIFNWTYSRSTDSSGSDPEVLDEQKLILYNHLNEQAKKMLDRGLSKELVGMIVASQVTPMYDFKDLISRVLFNMHMTALDRDYVEPKVYVDEDVVNGWTVDDKIFAARVIRYVLTEIRALFTTAKEDETSDLPAETSPLLKEAPGSDNPPKSMSGDRKG